MQKDRLQFSRWCQGHTPYRTVKTSQEAFGQVPWITAAVAQAGMCPYQQHRLGCACSEVHAAEQGTPFLSHPQSSLSSCQGAVTLNSRVSIKSGTNTTWGEHCTHRQRSVHPVLSRFTADFPSYTMKKSV